MIRLPNNNIKDIASYVVISTTPFHNEGGITTHVTDC